jgi:hypothetical protein
MNDVRHLENRFLNVIEWHIKKAFPNIKGNLAPSTDKEDTELSFDAKIDDKQISIRIRKHKYLKYPDLTIRSRSKNGGKTEIDKIKEGLAQIYFYSYMDEQEKELVKVRIVDVNSIRELTKLNIFEHRKNKDITEFYTYKFKDIKQYNGDIYKYDKI